MRKLLLSLLLLIPLLGPAQNPQLNQQFSFTTTQATTAVDIRGRGLNYFRIAWDFNGNTFPSACSVQLQISSFGTLWTTAATGTCTSQGQSAFVQASANFIRLNLVTFTPASVGDLVVNITGFTTNPASATSTVNIQATNGDALTDTSGSLNVNVTGGSTGNGAASNTGAAVPAQADYLGANVGGNLTGITGTGTSLNVNCTGGCASASDTVGTPVALNGINAAATVAMAGQKGATVTFGSGNFVGSVTAEYSYDNGVTYLDTLFINGGLVNSASVVNPNNTSRSIFIPAGVTNAGVYVSIYTSGTVTATVRAVASNQVSFNIIKTGPGSLNFLPLGGESNQGGDRAGLMVVGRESAGTVVGSFSPVMVGGSDYGGTLHPQTWKVDSSGSGQVIANAGTNLNTSTLALETGGNLAASKTDLDTIVTNTTGLATSANQTTENASLSTIATNTTGAATATNQTTGNTSLTSIVTNTTNSARETGGQLERLNQQITSLIKAQPTVNPLNKSVPVTIINTTIVDPCQNKKIFVAISQTATTQLINAIPGWSIYLCGILVVGADAENVSLVYGTGTTCGTGTIAMIGGTSAANGPNLAANGGFNQGFANASISYAIPGQNVCLQQSGAGRVAGNLSYVISSN